LHQFGIAEDGGEGGAQLVAHVRNELALVRARDLEVLDCLGQLACARLDLLEQAAVLNRDHGLVGERCDKLDVPLLEGPNSATTKHDHSNGLAFAQQRHAEMGAVSTKPLSFG
jgi:hypothetical protein